MAHLLALVGPWLEWCAAWAEAARPPHAGGCVKAPALGGEPQATLRYSQPLGAKTVASWRAAKDPKIQVGGPGERWLGAVQRDVDRLADSDGVHSAGSLV